MQSRDKEDQADRYDGDTLENTQGTGIEQQDVLGEQCKTHKPATDREARKIDDAP